MYSCQRPLTFSLRKEPGRTPPTDEQVERLRELGILLEKKSKSKKELAEAAFPAITDPDLLDSEQQALDTLISKTEEKGGKNGQKQQS